MNLKPPIEQHRLKEALEYDLETGDFIWRIRRGRCAAGSRAGTLNHHGYIAIQVDGRLREAQRWAWLYVHGTWPDREIDHINGNKADNRIANLRLATRSQNLMNARMHRNNRSGIKGVIFFERDKTWIATIRKDGRVVHCSYHKSADEAAAVRASVLSHHHGEFARTA